MFQPPDGFETVFAARGRRECRHAKLVLEAARIPSDAVFQNGWFLVVADADAADAFAELAAYKAENEQRSAAPAGKTQLYGGAIVGVVAYSLTIIAFHLFSGALAYGVDWLSVGRVHAGDVTGGQFWRVVTALTLHADVEHLGGNLVFGAVFGFMAGRTFGGGIAWLTIVVAGSFGNLLNAYAREANHSSIGASTAVFAALGLMVANALRPRLGTNESLLRRWSPLIGGIVLLGFIGVGGERTDVLAHVTGFFAGLIVGWLCSYAPHRFLDNATVQTIASIAGVVIVAAAWAIGISSLAE